VSSSEGQTQYYLYHKVQLSCDADVIVSHVAGTQMIAQGTDGVSQGLLTEGVNAGLDMLTFIPPHLNAIERHPPLLNWLCSWLGHNSELLTPDQWFSRGHSHDGGGYDQNGFWRVKIRSRKFIWAPPPAAADVAVEELRKALIRRRDCTHVFICLRLLTPQWRRHLNKACVLVLFTEAGSEAWPIEMYEPLTIGIVFPFLSVRPWQIHGTTKMIHLGRTTSDLLKDMNMVTGDLLLKLCEQMWRLCTMPENVVQRVLYFSPNNPVPCETEREL
jgi:hypothetical protein